MTNFVRSNAQIKIIHFC